MLVLPLSRGELGSLAPPKTHTLRGHLFGHPGLVAFAAEVRSPLAMDPDGATECVVEKLKKKDQHNESQPIHSLTGLPSSSPST